MSFKIVRNDISKMETQAIVNTANAYVEVGPGCDETIYNAAGFDELFNYRRDNIGEVPEGEAFITPGFNLKAEYIIHAVSPFFMDGKQGEEALLRSCYRKSLALAKEHGITSISFPLISTGEFGYPKEEGIRIAVDEIYDFLFDNEMDVILVVFDDKSTELGEKIYPGLKDYIADRFEAADREAISYNRRPSRRNFDMMECAPMCLAAPGSSMPFEDQEDEEAAFEALKSKLDERKAHLADSFSQYLLYLISLKGMTNAEVYKNAIIDKKLFAKIKNDPDYHPQKITCLCLCVGARLSLDETRDLLARAGYALSPCDMRDIIFSYFIENEHYDMVDIDIQLEEYGLPCVIM